MIGLFSLVEWFFWTRIGNLAGLALAAIAAVLALEGYVAWQRHEAAAEARVAYAQEQTRATAQEAKRRIDGLEAARRDADGMAALLASQNTQLQQKLAENAHASAAYDDRVCLADPQLERLRELAAVGGRRRAGAAAAQRSRQAPAGAQGAVRSGGLAGGR
jgi:predicted negative regulator of RcsB-dependent stress response